jgi:hypothetical protein
MILRPARDVCPWGATTAELQARLGHSNSVAAQLYRRTAKDRDRQIAERSSKLVEGAE